jgi:uncharacterized RDD family membrane protein YckC
MADSVAMNPVNGLPAGVKVASPWLRLGGYLLDAILVTVTFGIGWLIWAAIIVGEGQTPAKRLLRMRVINKDSLRPVGWSKMLLMRGLIAGLVATIAIPITLGIILLMPLWDGRNRNLWDKVSGTFVVTDPDNAWAMS